MSRPSPEHRETPVTPPSERASTPPSATGLVPEAHQATRQPLHRAPESGSPKPTVRVTTAPAVARVVKRLEQRHAHSIYRQAWFRVRNRVWLLHYVVGVDVLLND
jgi:hypothetical protein